MEVPEVSILSQRDAVDLAEKTGFKVAEIVIAKLSSEKSPDWNWVSNKECARLTGFSKSTLQRYRESGLLLFSKVGGNIFYRRSDLNALLERNLRIVSEQVPA